MQLTKKHIIIISILMILFIATSFIVIYNSMQTVSAETVPTSAWTDFNLTFTNNVDDYTFKLPAQYRFSKVSGFFEVKILAKTIAANKHYFARIGYDYNITSTNAATKPELVQNEYYLACFNSFNDVVFDINYQIKTLNIVFIDEITGEQIATMPASKSATLTPPVAPDHSSDGFCFVGWSSKEYENVQRNATIYAQYAPARYVTVTYPDNTTDKIAVPYGATMQDVQNKLKAYDGVFDMFSSTGRITDKVDIDTAVTHDMQVFALYQAMEWWKIMLICLAVLAVLGLILFFVFKK